MVMLQALGDSLSLHGKSASIAISCYIATSLVRVFAVRKLFPC